MRRGLRYNGALVRAFYRWGVRQAAQLAAFAHIDEGLPAVVLVGQPLHVAGLVLAACAQWSDVVNRPARAGASGSASCRAGVYVSKGSDFGSGSLDRLREG